MRRVFFQIHLWTGLTVGLYVCLVFVTGAALVYRVGLQRALDPHLFTPKAAGPPADAATIMERVSQAYPEHRLAGVEAPTTTRPTYLAYVTRGAAFVTVLIDPASGDILGELPDRPIIGALQEIHFNLLAGRRGRIVNGIGAGAVLVMCVTGVVIWWPGAGNIRSGLTVSVRRGWRRTVWELHRALGIWTVLLTAMWAATGFSFVFPAPLQSTITWLSPITASRAPVSRAPVESGQPRPSWRTAIEHAQRYAPGLYVARVVAPRNERAALLVLLADARPTPTGPGHVTSVYLDQYTLERLSDSSGDRRTMGDAIMSWLGPLHFGNFGGAAVRLIWFIGGLTPPLLFVTGFTMWWTRVVRPRRLEAMA